MLGSLLSKYKCQFIFFVSVAVILLVSVAYRQNLIKKENDLKIKKTEIEKKTKELITDEIKKELLKSNSLSAVTLGTAITFIPLDKIEMSPGFKHYDFISYGVELDSRQGEQFTNSLPADRYLSSISDYLYFDSPNWLQSIYASGPQSGVDILLKSGYVCFISSNLESDKQHLDCSYVSEPKENTLNKVSEFIINSLKKAAVDCGDKTCLVKESIVQPIPIPQYSRHIINFQDINMKDKRQIISLVENELEQSQESFKRAGWKVKKEDITNKERGWDKNTLISVNIEASNKLFSCDHTITVSTFFSRNTNLQKRHMIECWINSW